MASAWRSVLLGNKIQSVGACYAIYGDGKLFYIGSTKNLNKRILQHKSAKSIRRKKSWESWVTIWGTFKTILVKYRPAKVYGDWAMVELRLIKRLNPPGNRVVGHPARSVARIAAGERYRGLQFSSGYRARM